MMRLIDADRINFYKATVARGMHSFDNVEIVEKFQIDRMPTIDPESLRPRGTWEGTADGYADGELVYDTWTCSECGYTVDTDNTDDLTRFCPNCGAKMEGDAQP